MNAVGKRVARLRLKAAAQIIGAQMHRVGFVAVAIPLVVASIIGFGGMLAARLAGAQMAEVVMMLLVQLYPVSVGACAVAALGEDELIELQESMPVGFRTVQLARLGIVVLGGAAGALIVYAPLHAVGIFPNDVGPLSVLTPAGGAVVVTLVAYAAVSVAGSVRTATMAVIAVLVCLTLFWDWQVPDPVTQRQGPLLIAGAAAGISWVLSGRSEKLLARAGGVQ
ncbi:hypothetical protein [Raoultibacter phocaeensis]|uniref:hypothetical protein n=1 Tax=Raoultibacter phocaeensis TaxID=2479841 RepID=UPI00111B1370|nr:hypothetical protein [Raoultibacter phocaeensis]